MSVQENTRRKAKRRAAVYTMKVSLRDVQPRIWRRIQISEDAKLPSLHRVLQLLFNWEDCHLHQFVVRQQIYSVPDPDDESYGRKVLDENNVPLNRVAQRVGDTFEYHYDFGDDWRLEILLESIVLAAPEVSYPRCIAGARNGPPEDSGGPFGYMRYVEALANPDDDEHEHMLAWRGPFDPEAFSVEAINVSLSRSFHRQPIKSARGVKHQAKSPTNPAAGELTARMLAWPEGNAIMEIPRHRVAPGTRIALELTDAERELILKHSLAPDELTAKLRVVPKSGASCVVRYTLDELDELAGYVASESNHAKDGKLHKKWHQIFRKIAAILESHTDE